MAKKYTLEDGQVVDIHDIINHCKKEFNCVLRKNTVYRRISEGHRTMEKLARPVFDSHRREGHKKVYTLTDGTEITALELADKVGITSVSAHRRLHRSLDPKIVFAEPRVDNPKLAFVRNKELKEEMSKRNFYCPMWQLLNRVV